MLRSGAMLSLTAGSASTVQCRFHYVEAGRGSAVLLLHGGATSHREWTYLLPYLAERFRVIAPDLPGCGQSERPREGYDRTTLGRAIVELVKALGEERVAVVAHGLGAFLAIEVAAATPYVVSKLAMISPITGALDRSGRRLAGDEAMTERQIYGGPGTPIERARRAATSLIEDEEVRRRYLATLEGVPDGESAAIDELLARAGSVQDGVLLQALRCPTLIVRPTLDGAFTPEQAERIARLVPLGRLIDVPDAGHFAAVEQPAALAAALVSFLLER